MNKYIKKELERLERMYAVQDVKFLSLSMMQKQIVKMKINLLRTYQYMCELEGNDGANDDRTRK